MTRELHRRVAALAGAALGRPVEIRRTLPVGGGSLHHAEILELTDGRRLFLKSNPQAPADMFEREAEGLEALAEAGVLRVPRDVLTGDASGVPFVLMEAIRIGPAGPRFFEDLGRGLALLHQASLGERYGFAHDNYLGTTPQPNSWSDDWCDFFRRQRLAPQLERARHRGLSDESLDLLGERLLDRLEDFLVLDGEPPCLLHGDLWGGNYLVADSGEGVLIDPAAYYGQREADLAMTRLFGGFPTAFYRAYEEVWPLPPGHPERLLVYQLYHLLNHLNLFGRGYLDRCLAVLARLV